METTQQTTQEHGQITQQQRIDAHGVTPSERADARSNFEFDSSKLTTKQWQKYLDTGEMHENAKVKPIERPESEKLKVPTDAEARRKWQMTGELPDSEQDPTQQTAGESKEGEAAKKAEGKDEGKQTVGEEKGQRRLSGYEQLLERAAKEPEFDRVVERLHEPFFPLSREGHARYQVMAYALNQVSNRQDVLYFLARPENASVALSMQDAAPHKIAQTVHMISAELMFGVKKGAAKKTTEKKVSSAPPPPHEVSSRSAPPADEVDNAVKREDFNEYARAANERALRVYGRRRR